MATEYYEGEADCAIKSGSNVLHAGITTRHPDRMLVVVAACNAGWLFNYHYRLDYRYRESPLCRRPACAEYFASNLG